MAIPKQIANKVLTNLDVAATKIERLAKSGKIEPRLASQLIRDVDSFADRFETAAFGKDSLQRRQAKVLQHDADEKYMATFNNPNKPIQVEADEGYMHKVDASARWDGIGTYDVDMTATVSERQEYAVVDQSPMSNGGKTVAQPSWKGGAKKHKASTKSWAD
jgi:hypothetical protein